MLSFNEKLAVMESFPQLERRDVSMGRVNFHYERSVIEKKNVGFHFHPNGNGFIFAGEIDGVDTDEKGFVNIRDYSEEELRSLVQQAIDSLTGDSSWEEGQEEKWFDSDRNELQLKFEDDMWYLFSGLNLEMAFETYEEAREYLREEGFNRL
ncbi:hypothetical protein D7Z26_18130 [Cohnella endophytica]|uniref:Uncharacterized protein n=1 Tax=Cohnella endophytica TaxID=2419778 RepID=A0A494XS62_9BACL|nr:hypothetical protein [Cohnella endophytica]RKP51686.1 hypothetical protein D7Z26_18130 [Cohnella endophytica]